MLIFENQFSGRSSRSSAHTTSVRSFKIFVSTKLAGPLLLTRRLLGVPESLFTDCVVGLHLAAVVLDIIMTFLFANVLISRFVPMFSIEYVI